MQASKHKPNQKTLNLEELSVTTQKKTLFRKEALTYPLYATQLSRSKDFLNWKDEVKCLKTSCSQSILTAEIKQVVNPNITVVMCQSDSSQTHLQCINNDGKKAKYIVTGGNGGVYCLKCAIKLMQKGVQISEIADAPQNVKRQLRSKPLLEELRGTLRKLESSWKALGQNYFFVQMQEEKDKVAAVYDKAVQVILKMKQADLRRLSVSRQTVIKRSKEQIESLKSQHKQIELVVKELSTTHVESVSPKQMESCRVVIERVEQYLPLEFSLKRQEIQSIKQRIVTVIQRQFCDKEYPIHYSFNDKSCLQVAQENDNLILNQLRGDGRESKGVKQILERNPILKAT